MIASLGARLRPLLHSPFLRNAGRYSSSSVASQALMMVYTILIARTLGPDLGGKFSGCYALAGLTAFAFNWGMDTWLLREPGSLASPRIWVGRVLQVKIASGIVWVVILLILAPLARPDTFTIGMVLISALDIWCDGALSTHQAGFNIQNRFQVISRVMLISRAGRLLGAVILIALDVQTPLWFAAARLAATFLGLAASAYLLGPDLSGQGAISNRAVLRASAPFGVSEFLALIYMQADVTMLTILGGSALAGLYSPSTGIANAFFLIPSSVFMITVPVLSRQLANEPARFKGSILRISLGFIGLGFVMMVVMAVAGNWIVRVFLGPKYLATSVLVVILSPLLFLKSLEFGWASVLVAVGWQRQRLLPQSISAAINVLLNIWAIPRFGLPGVAAVYLASELILAFGYGLLVIQWLRHRHTFSQWSAISRTQA